MAERTRWLAAAAAAAPCLPRKRGQPPTPAPAPPLCTSNCSLSVQLTATLNWWHRLMYIQAATGSYSHVITAANPPPTTAAARQPLSAPGEGSSPPAGQTLERSTAPLLLPSLACRRYRCTGAASTAGPSGGVRRLRPSRPCAGRRCRRGRCATRPARQRSPARGSVRGSARGSVRGSVQCGAGLSGPQRSTACCPNLDCAARPRVRVVGLATARRDSSWAAAGLERGTCMRSVLRSGGWVS